MSPYFVGTCVVLEAKDLEAYDETERDITYRTFRKHVGREIIEDINRFNGVPIHKDWAVGFGKGRWKGKPAVCMHHSEIHHIWLCQGTHPSPDD